MANRPRGYGMTAEVAHKMLSKYDIEQELQARAWIEAITGEPLEPQAEPGNKDVKKSAQLFHEALKNGVAICNLINIIAPGSVKKINKSKMAFMLMENTGNFLTACEKYGCRKDDLFQTVDLYENQNMGQVVGGIHALGRQAQKKKYPGPALGVKEATQNKREFTEEQLKEGQNVIGLQMGTNKGASQAGMNMGNTRHIID